MGRRRSPVAIGALIALVWSLAPVTAPAAFAAPEVPTIIGPTGGTTSASPTFAWSQVPDAVLYRVWIDTPLSTGNPPIETVNTLLTDVLFQRSTQVDWSVAAVDGDGNESAKATASFEVGPLTPTLVFPPDGTAFSYPADSPSIQWQPAFDGGGALYYLDDRVGDGPLPDLAGLSSYRAELGGDPGTWRWTAGQVLTPPSGSAPVRTFTVEWPDSTPSLVAPADGSDVASTAPMLSWSTIDGASGYDVQLDEDAGFASPITVSNVRLTTAPVSGLTSGTWHWRVRAREPHDGTGAWSSSRSFAVPAVAVPTMLGPSDGANLTEYPVLTWEPPAGADGYDIELTPDINDPNLAPRDVDATAFVAEPTGWTTDHPIPFGPGPVTLHWRVRATFPLGPFAHGATTDWSGWRSFTVDPPNGPPVGAPVVATLEAPATCANLETCATHPWSPVLDWDPVDGAAFYRVFLQHGGDGTGPENSSYDTAGSTFVDRFASSTAPVVGWDVVACGSTADCPTSKPSLSRRYVVQTPGPTVVGPADGTHAANASVLLSWTAPVVDPSVPTTAAGFYEIGLQTVVNGDWFPWQTQFVNAAQTSFALSNIYLGAEWQWRIRALPVDGGLPSEWSAWRSFDRPRRAPTITSPSDGATVDSTPHLAWIGATAASAGYRVDIVRGDPAAPGDWPGLQQWHFNVTGRSLDVYPNLAPGSYTWRVSEDGADLVDPTGATDIGHFVVPAVAPPVLISPAAGATIADDRGVFTWDAVPGAATYRVEVASDQDFAPANLIGSGDAWGTTFALRVRLPAGSVYWRVMAFAPGYQVIGSGASSFTLGTSAPRLAIARATMTDTTAPIVSAPSRSALSGALVSGTAPNRFTWSGSDPGPGASGIARYELEQSTDGGAWSAPMVQSTAMATRNLAPGHLYRFRVRAVDEAANVGTWVYGTTFRLSAVSQASSLLHYAGTWTTSTSTIWWGGTAKASSKAGSTVSYAFTGKSIAWVGLKGVGRGKAAVYVNGVLKATVDLYSPTTLKQRIVWSANYATSASRTVTIRVLGTTGRPRVDVDGFIVGS